MAVQPEDIRALAEALLEHSHESHHRSAASRAYYAAYHAARALEQHYDLLIGGGGATHQAFLGRLREYRNPAAPDTARSINALGYLLTQMVGVRNVADYEIGSDFSQDNAQENLEQANRVFQKVKGLLPE